MTPDDNDNTPRLNAELSLLHAMYPSEISHSPKTSELKYHDDAGALVLRLPSDYPSSAKPTVISANSKASSTDLHDQIRKYINTLDTGDELLDLIIAAFQDLTSQPVSSAQMAPTASFTNHNAEEQPLTVIIWLHHLLALSKRKLALHPSSSPQTTYSVANSTSNSSNPNTTLTGLTKPGHPGVLIYTGPASLVRAHVTELRSMNWQAFQVRYEEAELWRFDHDGVRECESMGGVVEAVGERREVVMGVLKIK